MKVAGLISVLAAQALAQVGCCKAITADCLACQAGASVTSYCAEYPFIPGCAKAQVSLSYKPATLYPSLESAVTQPAVMSPLYPVVEQKTVVRPSRFYPNGVVQTTPVQSAFPARFYAFKSVEMPTSSVVFYPTAETDKSGSITTKFSQPVAKAPCCKAITAECLACQAGKTIPVYCQDYPFISGCASYKPSLPKQGTPTVIDTRACIAEGRVIVTNGKGVVDPACMAEKKALRTVPVCNNGKEFNACGSQCPLSCENPVPGICVMSCNRGCFCPEGTVEADDGTCVAPSECPPKPVPVPEPEAEPEAALELEPEVVCREVMCRTTCEWGFVQDEDGCDTCSCMDEPTDKNNNGVLDEIECQQEFARCEAKYPACRNPESADCECLIDLFSCFNAIDTCRAAVTEGTSYILAAKGCVQVEPEEPERVRVTEAPAVACPRIECNNIECPSGIPALAVDEETGCPACECREAPATTAAPAALEEVLEENGWEVRRNVACTGEGYAYSVPAGHEQFPAECSETNDAGACRHTKSSASVKDCQALCAQDLECSAFKFNEGGCYFRSGELTFESDEGKECVIKGDSVMPRIASDLTNSNIIYEVVEVKCCKAMTATCLACAARVSVEVYCDTNPSALGCVGIGSPPTTEAAVTEAATETEAAPVVTTVEATTAAPVITTVTTTEATTAEATTAAPAVTTVEATTEAPAVTTEAPAVVTTVEATTEAPAVVTEAATTAEPLFGGKKPDYEGRVKMVLATPKKSKNGCDGILSAGGDVCCPMTCGLCGGQGCAMAPGGADECCLARVKTANKMCSLSPPPCVTQPTISVGGRG